MNVIVNLFFISSLLLIGCSPDGSVGELQVQADKAQRSVKKAVNRAKEAACGKLTEDNKLECLAEKIKHRAVETKDIVLDKSKEVKDKVY